MEWLSILYLNEIFQPGPYMDYILKSALLIHLPVEEVNSSDHVCFAVMTPNPSVYTGM